MRTHKRTLAFIAASCVAMTTTPLVRADHHEEDMLKGKIAQFYANLSSGNFEDAFAFIKNGATGFMPHGLMTTIPSQDVKAMIVQQMKKTRSQGATFDAHPKHLSIHMLGEAHASANYYVEGSEKQGDHEPEPVLNRATLILAKDGEDWKIIHWHVSELTRGDEGH